MSSGLVVRIPFIKVEEVTRLRYPRLYASVHPDWWGWDGSVNVLGVWLTNNMKDVEPRSRGKGVLVSAVESPDSSSLRKIREGGLVIRVGDYPVFNVVDVVVHLCGAMDERSIRLVVRRSQEANDPLVYTTTLHIRPDDVTRQVLQDVIDAMAAPPASP